MEFILYIILDLFMLMNFPVGLDEVYLCIYLSVLAGKCQALDDNIQHREWNWLPQVCLNDHCSATTMFAKL